MSVNIRGSTTIRNLSSNIEVGTATREVPIWCRNQDITSPLHLLHQSERFGVVLGGGDNS